mmetsp:Transcript_29771/g.40095  ORF Transcript_29771/g.40095 Transcript_29771/m.40095 type:complete len:97 (+) Transcript_29771:3-293(+)
MSAQDKLIKAGIPALMEAADARAGSVDTYGGSASGELGNYVRAGVPLPGLNKVVPATFPSFSKSAVGGVTRGQLQAKRIGSIYGPGVTPPVWLARP